MNLEHVIVHYVTDVLNTEFKEANPESLTSFPNLDDDDMHRVANNKYATIQSRVVDKVREYLESLSLLQYFSYVDWEIGEDDQLRVGDFLGAARNLDCYETLVYGEIVKHPDNDMPVLLANVDPDYPGDSGEYIGICDLFVNGYTFTRLIDLSEVE